MAAGRSSRPTSSTSNTSLLQDVPGTLRPPISSLTSISSDDGQHEDSENNQDFTSLPAAVYARRSEYVRPREVRIKVGTWNVASCKGTEKDLAGWFIEGKGLAGTLPSPKTNSKRKGKDDANIDDAQVESIASQEERYKRKSRTIPIGEDESVLPSNDEVGLYVLALQEIVDITSAQEALKPYTDPSVANRWKDEMKQALPDGYKLVAEQQLLGLLLLVYASPEVKNEVKSVSTTSVGTGLMGYMGNKGAVTARLVLGETTRLVFVNSHLAAGADKAALERRNWDFAQVVNRTRFEPIRDAMDLKQTTGEQIGDEDFAFWMGDLNYRLDGIPGEDVRRLLMLHTRNKFDLSRKSATKIDAELSSVNPNVERRVEERLSVNSSGSESVFLPPPPDQTGDDVDAKSEASSEDIIDPEADPASLKTTLLSLLPHDQLHQQMKLRKAFHDGWKEGDISFLPTYKYDVGCVGVFDSSEKKRAPSWCDRILYRTRRDKLTFDAIIEEEELARKKDEEMRMNGLAQAAEDEDVLYSYDSNDNSAIGASKSSGEYDEYDEYDEDHDTNTNIESIVTKEGFEDEIQLEYYVAHQRVLSSDHKPLDAIFKLKYDAVVPSLKADVLSEVAREMDRRENEGRPNVTVVVDKHGAHDVEVTDENPITFPGIYLGDVRWGEGKHRTLTIANTSRVSASISFIERPVGAGQTPGIAPSWIDLKFGEHGIKSSSHGSPSITLDPGDTCPVEVHLRIFDLETARSLSDGRQHLEDVLVLRVENGRDHFIPIRGNWQNTSLGQSIDMLCRVPEGGIRRLQGQRPHGGRKTAPSTADPLAQPTSPSSVSAKSVGSANHKHTIDDDELLPVRSSAPRELFRLTEAIEDISTRVIAEWDILNIAPAHHGSERGDEVLLPPWKQYTAWPFDEKAWLQEQQDEEACSAWDAMLSQACDALDCDRPLDSVFTPHTQRLRQLYILSSLLISFMQGFPEGVVTDEAWAHIEGYLINNVEKSKPSSQNFDSDATKVAVQDIILQCSSAAHSVSLILITSFLQRIQTEVLGASVTTPLMKEDPQSPSGSSLPSSPTSRRRTLAGPFRQLTGLLSKATVSDAPLDEPSVVRRSSNVRTAMAKIFADILIRSEIPSSEKAKQVLMKRKVRVLEAFLEKEGL